jgi:hypothetical protein
MPEPLTTAAAAVAAKAITFPTTLLLLFFITPPANGPKAESTSLWTLQSTSQLQTDTPEMCVKIAKDMIAEVKPVKTLTVRAYCLCPAGNGSDNCFNEEEASERMLSPNPADKPRATIQRIGPNTVLKEPGAARR